MLVNLCLLWGLLWVLGVSYPDHPALNALATLRKVGEKDQ